MGIFDKIKGQLGAQFLDVIEWTSDDASLIAWRFPIFDKAIQDGGQLVVREGQVAIFVQVSSFQEETNFAGLYVEALLVVKLIVQFLDGEFSVLVRIRIVEETLDVWSVDVVEKMICRGATMLLAST